MEAKEAYGSLEATAEFLQEFAQKSFNMTAAMPEGVSEEDVKDMPHPSSHVFGDVEDGSVDQANVLSKL